MDSPECSKASPDRLHLKELLRQATNGDDQARQALACQALFDAMSRFFLAAVRRKMARRLRSIFDLEDFLQDARQALCEKPLQRSCGTVKSFIAYVTGLIHHQVLDANRKYLDCQKRDLRRSISLDEIRSEEEPGNTSLRLLTRLTIQDKWKSLLDRQPKSHRRILEMLRDGLTQSQIAQELHISERTIYRLLTRLRQCRFHEFCPYQTYSVE